MRSIADAWPPALRALVDRCGEVEFVNTDPQAKHVKRIRRRLPDGRYETLYIYSHDKELFP